jgi:hypothetical protein
MCASKAMESIRIRCGLIERVLTNDLMSSWLSLVIRSSPNLWLSFINVVASGSLHQRKTAEIALRQSFSDIGFHLLMLSHSR